MTSQQERALVLGGTGFIGRALCDALHEARYSVIAVGRRPTSGLPGRLLRADLMTADLEGLLAEVEADVVVNAAGAVWNPTEREMVESNTMLVGRLLTALASLDRRSRLVHLGSSKEYGPVPEGTTISENSHAHPLSTYGRTKLEATMAVLDATRRGEVDGVVLRLPTLIGPRSPAPSLLGRLSAELAEAARQERPAVVRLSPLTAVQDFLDVDDLATAVTAAARSRTAVGRIINLGYGEAIAVRTVVDVFIAVSGVRTRVVEERQTRQGDQASTSSGVPAANWQKLDISAARQLLGWAPRTPLRDAIARAWDAVDPRQTAASVPE